MTRRDVPKCASVGGCPASFTDKVSYSFDYGNVHFVTYDSYAIVRASQSIINETVNWIKNDLQNSNATWKIVFGHHPFGGSPDKGESPADNYFGKRRLPDG